MSPLMPEPLKHDYCGNCHLATPTWRKRCIHCYEPIGRSSKDSKGAGSYKIAAVRNPGRSRVQPNA
jgi:hypothetical protein